MRKAVSPGNRWFSPQFVVYFALILVSFVSLLFSTRSFFLNVEDIGMGLLSGLRGGLNFVSSSIARTVDSIHELADLRAQYGELQKKVERLETLERDAAGIRQENIRLKEQLGFRTELQYRSIAAKIIGRDPDNLYSALVLDKGSRQGIAKNLPVVAYQNGVQGLVGKVIQVSRNESLVMPVFDAKANIAVRLAQSRYEGIAAGQGDVDFPVMVRYVKKRAKPEINFGDLVITSGLGGVFPADIQVGRVARIIDENYATSLDLEIEPIIDYAKLEYVFVIDPLAAGANDD
jgi:rod shape-determining protein MreC